MRLFKYLRPERVDVLLGRIIGFSKPTRFNDPFDCLPYFVDSGELNPLGARTYFLQAKPEDIGLPRYKEEVRDHVQRSFAADPSFTLQAIMLVDPIPKEEHHGGLARNFRSSLAPFMQDSVIALSLTENRNSLLMWAHYAADHTGFVIGFDSDHPFFHSAGSNPSNPGFLNRVVYSDDRPSGIVGTLSAEKAYLTKSSEWSYEREWRILQHVKNATSVKEVPGGEVYLFAFPSEAVTEVVIGARASLQTKENVRSVMSDKATWPNAMVFQASVDQRHYRLNYEPTSI
jgi:Protein of unknown function (DUF2971)